MALVGALWLTSGKFPLLRLALPKIVGWSYLLNPHTYFCIHVFHVILPQAKIFSLTTMPQLAIELTLVQLHLFEGP